MPSSYVLHSAAAAAAESSTWPHAFTTAYAETAAEFGGMIEVRVGRNTQHLPVFVRMLDKDSRWGYDNGLRTLVTTLLQGRDSIHSQKLAQQLSRKGSQIL